MATQSVRSHHLLCLTVAVLYAAAVAGCDQPEDAVLETPPSLPSAVISQVGAGGPEGFVIVDVRDGALFRDCGFAIASNMDHQVHVFDRDGKHVRSLGREGEGPGEFESVHGVGVVGDGRIVVWDPQLGRETVFGAGQDFDTLRTVDFARNAANLPSSLGWNQEGEMFFTQKATGMYALRDHPTGLRRDTVGVLRISPGETRPLKILTLVGEKEWFYSTERSWGQRPLLFGSELILAVSDEGVSAGRTGEGTVTLFDHDGNQLSEHSVSGTKVRPTPDMIDRERRKVEQDMIDRSRGLPVSVSVRHIRERVQAIPAAENLPLYSDLIPHPGEGTWIKQPSTSGASQEAMWTLLDREGRPIGSVELKSADEILDVNDECLLVLRKNEFDVESVAVVELSLPGRARSSVGGGE